MNKCEKFGYYLTNPLKIDMWNFILNNGI